MDKATLREQHLSARRRLTDEQASEHAAAIARRLQDFVIWEEVGRLHVYRSRPEWHEVDTSWLESYIAANWPHVELTTGDISHTALLPEESYDVIIVPLVAFDEQCNRLGLGGGWYDRFLAMQPQAQTIGLAYELQYAPSLPTEPHDIALDHVATEARIVTRSAFHQ